MAVADAKDQKCLGFLNRREESLGVCRTIAAESESLSPITHPSADVAFFSELDWV